LLLPSRQASYFFAAQALCFTFRYLNPGSISFATCSLNDSGVKPIHKEASEIFDIASRSEQTLRLFTDKL
jgi:hypothetical protein